MVKNSIGETEHTLLSRLTPADYANNTNSLINRGDPVAIAQTVFDQDGDMPNSAGLSTLFVSWGQFTDHDLSLTPDTSGEFVAAEGLAGPLERSVFDEATGVDTAREHINIVTPQMDGSQIYGSDAEREASLREGAGGRLRVSDDANSPYGLLPYTDGEEMAGDRDPGNPLYLAGDIRANENTGLTLLHTIFVREHNYWAERLAEDHPDWNDDMLFAAARSIVEAELQKITYQDWLPHLIADATPPDLGYDPDADPSISTEFSTAAFRFGHTAVASKIARMMEDGATAPEGDLSVAQAFFNIEPFQSEGVDTLVRGQTGDRAQEIDAKVIDDLNFFLVLGNGATGFSLPALNILRGRDHGLSSYLEVRAELLGDIDLTTVAPDDFSLITSDPALQADLETVYASVWDVDLWVGGLAEDDLPGAQLGPTFSAIIADQFSRTRAADAGFGAIDSELSAEILTEVQQTSLADILARTTGVEHLQADVFKAITRKMGGEQRDQLVSDAGDTMLMGLDGADLLIGRGGNDALYGGDGRDTLLGKQGDDMLIGEGSIDDLHGGAGDDLIDGGAGADMISGGTGNDDLRGGDGRDQLRGGGGDDHLDGGEGADFLSGNIGDDWLYGGDGQDRLRGGAGDDVLSGGAQRDILIGDSGADIFRFEQGGGADVVRDFNANEDKLDLRAFNFESVDEVKAHTKQVGADLRLIVEEDRVILKTTDADMLNAENLLL